MPFTFVRDLSYYYSNFSLTFDDVKISNFFLDFNSSDITLKTSRDNGLFPAHKLVLSARSSVFAAMFSHGEVKENQNRLIEINDMSSEVMLAILKYIYTGDIEGYDYLYGDLLETARNVRGKVNIHLQT